MPDADGSPEVQEGVTELPKRIDMKALVARLRTERYRTCIIYDIPLSGKSAFARKLVDELGGVYINVLDQVVADSQLASRVDILDTEFLRGLIREAAKSTSHPMPVVCLDDLDFLLPIWGGQLQELLELARRLSATETAAVPVLLLQSHPALENAQSQNLLMTTFGENRVQRLDQIQAL